MTTVDTTEVDAALAKIQSTIEARILEVLNAAAEPMEEAAARNIRDRWYDTGDTLNSLATRQTNANEVNVGVQTDYAKHGEFGTYRLAPRAFMRDAFRSQLNNAKSAAQAKVNEIVSSS